MVISVHYLFQNYYYYPLFAILSSLSSLQWVNSHQDHPTSWTAYRQKLYIVVLRYGHRPSTAAPVASSLDKSPHPKIMTSEDGNAPSNVRPSLGRSHLRQRWLHHHHPKVLLQASSPTSYDTMMMGPLTPDQVPLSPRIGTSDGSISALSGRSASASRRQQTRDDLTHILSIYSLTRSPPLVGAVVIRLLSPSSF